MTQLFHQLGHRYQWSLQSIENDHAGDGIIIPARYMGMETVLSLSAELRANSIFDPQFYLPASTKGTLLTYPFFPQVIAKGFSTTDWDGAVANECARQCIDFQIQNGFKYIVIPTRIRDGMPADYIESQQNLFITPFINSYQSAGSRQPLFLQLLLNDQMIKEGSYQRDLLNWITRNETINGVYIILHIPSRKKQLTDIDLLIAYMSMIRNIKNSGMNVVLGYLNTESILLLAANPDIITMGSYENLRMFGTLPFEAETDDTRRGPNARIYISHLMQWIDHIYIGAISRVVDSPAEYFDESHYKITMFHPEYRWHFTKPEPYMHYFQVFSQQINRILSNDPANNPGFLIGEIERSRVEYQELDRRGIVFDDNSNGDHLASWLTALYIFARG